MSVFPQASQIHHFITSRSYVYLLSTRSINCWTLKPTLKCRDISTKNVSLNRLTAAAQYSPSPLTRLAARTLVSCPITRTMNFTRSLSKTFHSFKVINTPDSQSDTVSLQRYSLTRNTARKHFDSLSPSSNNVLCSVNSPE